MSLKDLTQEDILVLKDIISAAGIHEKNDPASLTIDSKPLYGPYQNLTNVAGTLSYPGIRPEMYSAFQRPRTMARRIGMRKSNIANEKIGIITGLTAGGGTNPSNYCGDPVTAGNLKRCVQNYVWGRWFMKTKLNALPEMGQRVDYADVPKRIMNLAQGAPNPFIPDIMAGINLNNPTGLQLANELFAVGAELERTSESVIITGDETQTPANTEVGWIKEFKGLERQIITGRADLDTGIACPAADSTIIAWNAAIDATVGGRTLPQAIVDTYFGLSDIADQVGLSVRWAIVMPSRLFRALTYIYSCQYYTSRCTGSAGNPQAAFGSDIVQLQQEMTKGKYLLIDGSPVEVIFSDGIPVNRITSSTYYADIFIIPIEADGVPLLNFEYMPMDNAEIAAFDGFGGLNTVTSINNGMMLVGKRSNGFCEEILFAAMARLVLDVPFLAARIDDITFTYQAPYRDAYPSNTSSYVDGGVSSWDMSYSAT